MTEPGRLGDPESSATAERLRVRVLGTFQVEGMDLRALRSRKARAVLKLLAMGRGRAVSLDRLVDGLWPNGGEPSQPDARWP